MRTLPTLAFAVALLVVLAPTARPSGCNIRWDQCYGDGGAINKSFACNTNTGSRPLVTSFVPASNVDHVFGVEFLVKFAADAPAMPAWWLFRNSGSCRQSSITLNFTNASMTGACPSWNNLNTAGGILSYTVQSNTATLVASAAISTQAAVPLVGGQEYFGFNLVVPNAGSVGAGSCAGCSTPVCIVFSAANIRTTIPGTSQPLTGPANQVDSDHATWQGGGAPTTPLGTGCPAATPTRKSTWGAVKSLYR